MTPSLLVKLLLILLFIPLAYGIAWAAQRWLPADNWLHKYLARNGKEKFARILLFAFYAIGGVVLTIVYS